VASVATLTYSSNHPVTINWGDGTTETYPASPPPATHTVHHTFSSSGPWTVVLTDTVNGMATTTQLTCSTCDVTGAELSTTDATTGTWTIGPIVNGTDGDVSVDWGDGTAADTVASGATGTHTYAPGVGSGPFIVTVTDPAVPGCTASVSGGNDPHTPDGPGVIVTPTLTLTCVGGDAQLSDVVTLTIAGPGTAYTVDWGDGTATETHPSGSFTHTYARPPGLLRTVTVTEATTTWVGTVTSQCEIAPIVTSLVCNFVANCDKLPADNFTTAVANPMDLHWAGTATTATYTVDWGDGTAPATITAGNATTHTYAAPGTYNVIWTVVGNASCIDNRQFTFPVA